MNKRNTITLGIAAIMTTLTIMTSYFITSFSIIASVEQILTTELTDSYFSKKSIGTSDDRESIKFFINEFNKHHQLIDSGFSFVKISGITLGTVTDVVTSDIGQMYAKVIKNDDVRCFPVKLHYSINYLICLVVFSFFLLFGRFASKLIIST